MSRLALFFLLLPLVFLPGTPASADPLSFMVQPMTIETEGQAATEQTGVITVSQEMMPAAAGTAGTPLRLRVYASDWTLDRSGTPQFLKAGTTPESCSSWLQINPVELVVQPGETSEVRYTIKIPAGVSGSYHSIIMFETAPVPMQAGPRMVAVNGRIGAAIYVQVGPQVKRARITGFAVTAQRTTLTVENAGNSQVRLKGVLQIQDADGHVVQHVPLPGGVVLPGQDHVRDLTLETPHVPHGHYLVTALLDYGGGALVGARAHVLFP